MNYKEQKKWEYIVWILVMAFAVIQFCFWADKKEIWFCDEVYSYESANGFEQEWPATYVDEWLSGKDVEKFFSADSENLSLNAITVRLYNDHVPLYFWLFRLISFYVFHGSGTMWIGFSINLIFYLILLGIGYKLFVKITNSPYVAALILISGGMINRLMLEQITTLRMYSMLLTEEVMLLLSAMWILKYQEQKRMSYGAFFSLFLCGLIGFLTHYDFWIFYAVTSTVFCSWLLINGIRSRKLFRCLEFKILLAWVGNFVGALLATIIIFPYCRWNLNKGKGEKALQSLLVFSKKKAEDILWGYRRQSIAVFGDGIPIILGLMILFGCIIGGAVLLYRKQEKGKFVNLILLVLVCQIYQLAVCFTFPAAAEERYLWGSFSIMVFAMLYGVYLIVFQLKALWKEKHAKYYLNLIMSIVIILFCMLQMNIMDGGKGIAYLFNPQKDVKVLEEYKSIPWVVYGNVMDAYSYYDILIPEHICFVTEKDSEADQKTLQQMPQGQQFILYTTEAYYAQAKRFVEETLGQEVVVEHLTTSVNLQVYLVKKTK